MLIYLFIINALSFLLMLTDKQKAKKGRWRIPEKAFITVALLGGSVGAIAGMKLFRHKTKHPKFSIGLPVIFAIQVIGAVVLVCLLRSLSF